MQVISYGEMQMKTLGFTNKEAVDAAKGYNKDDSDADIKAINAGYKF